MFASLSAVVAMLQEIISTQTLDEQKLRFISCF